VEMSFVSLYFGSIRLRRSPYGLGVSIYGLGVEQMDSGSELRVKVWTARKNEEEDPSQTCKQLLANEVNVLVSRRWRSKCLQPGRELHLMPVASRSLHS